MKLFFWLFDNQYFTFCICDIYCISTKFSRSNIAVFGMRIDDREKGEKIFQFWMICNCNNCLCTVLVKGFQEHRCSDHPILNSSNIIDFVADSVKFMNSNSFRQSFFTSTLWLIFLPFIIHLEVGKIFSTRQLRIIEFKFRSHHTKRSHEISILSPAEKRVLTIFLLHNLAQQKFTSLKKSCDMVVIAITIIIYHRFLRKKSSNADWLVRMVSDNRDDSFKITEDEKTLISVSSEQQSWELTRKSLKSKRGKRAQESKRKTINYIFIV